MPRQVPLSLAAAVFGVLALSVIAGSSSRVGGVVVLVAGILVILVIGKLSTRRGRHTPWEEARTQVRSDHAVVLWKPGCVYCERLLRALRTDENVTWVNVWQDAAAQREVCSLNGGDEYTPTVLVGERVLRNPTAQEVREALSPVRPERDGGPGGRSRSVRHPGR